MRLNRCPFCGSNKLEQFNYGDEYWVLCKDCDTDGPTGYSEEKAANLWNRRDAAAVYGYEEGETSLISKLREIEHVSLTTRVGIDVCPVCGKTKGRHHARDCWLGNALKEE